MFMEAFTGFVKALTKLCLAMYLTNVCFSLRDLNASLDTQLPYIKILDI